MISLLLLLVFVVGCAKKEIPQTPGTPESGGSVGGGVSGGLGVVGINQVLGFASGKCIATKEKSTITWAVNKDDFKIEVEENGNLIGIVVKKGKYIYFTEEGNLNKCYSYDVEKMKKIIEIFRKLPQQYRPDTSQTQKTEESIEKYKEEYTYSCTLGEATIQPLQGCEDLTQKIMEALKDACENCQQNPQFAQMLGISCEDLCSI